MRGLLGLRGVELDTCARVGVYSLAATEWGFTTGPHASVRELLRYSNALCQLSAPPSAEQVSALRGAYPSLADACWTTSALTHHLGVHDLGVLTRVACHLWCPRERGALSTAQVLDVVDTLTHAELLMVEQAEQLLRTEHMFGTHDDVLESATRLYATPSP